MKEVFNNMFSLIFAGIFISIFAYLFFTIFDTLFLVSKKAGAKVLGKTFNPSYNKRYMKKVWFGATKSFIPMQKKVSERYFLEVAVDNMRGLLPVNKIDYYKFKENDLVNVKYRKTRFSKKLMLS